MAKKSRSKTPVPAGETKADKFRRIAKQRVPKAIKAIQNIANLFNRNSYEFTDAQAQTVLDALDSACAVVEARTKAPAEKPQVEFEI